MFHSKIKKLSVFLLIKNMLQRRDFKITLLQMRNLQ